MRQRHLDNEAMAKSTSQELSTEATAKRLTQRFVGSAWSQRHPSLHHINEAAGSGQVKGQEAAFPLVDTLTQRAPIGLL